MFSKLINIIKYWHPKVALRYLPIVEEIEKEFTNKNLILEIGSGAIGIAPYLNREVVGADRDFSGKECSILKQVVADALNLPFADKSFDFVIASDVLEHIPQEKRKKAIKEWLRVAKNELIIAFPEGIEAEKQDRELYEEFKKRKCLDCAEKFFQDHLKYGLPKVEEVIKWIKGFMGDKGIKGEIREIDNLNLRLRKFLMQGWMTKNFFVDFFFRKIMLFFIPILRLFNNQLTYRKIIFVKIK